MNKCSHCGQPATIHFTSLVGTQKHTKYLCEACAREEGITGEIPLAEGGPLNLQTLVAMVLSSQPPQPQTEHLRCEACGMKYVQFRAEGRLGCSHDYDAFAAGLVPLLERVHSDVAHCGKVPRSLRARSELEQLELELHRAVTEERYEDAAALRDQLREKEQQP